MPASLAPVLWAAVTLGIYAASRAAYARFRRWWLSPLLTTWVACGALLIVCHTSYHEYLRGTHWLVTLLGPATVAFAIPIYEQRATIVRHWPVLLAGVVAGSVIAVGVSWWLAGLFQFSPQVRASLLPRSITTPFAIEMSATVGGVPALTASFTAVTGLFGAAVGESLLVALPLRSAFARGASFGMAAHGAGVAKARELGAEEGAVAGLVMVIAGLLNVLGATAWSAL
ncbi:LrgB family protein [Opitutus sp. ER46]|uniref:LrgB family protein n=1 Tax=Opitutus sp. ER46 TaxID=2161864 RepID=UPI000D2F60E2|nr:LrgB family protein [Opitutus sp. ER46]PTX91562.1 murein hydrolase effector protein LrgB [Opitutus sp. ER46]